MKIYVLDTDTKEKMKRQVYELIEYLFDSDMRPEPSYISMYIMSGDNRVLYYLFGDNGDPDDPKMRRGTWKAIEYDIVDAGASALAGTAATPHWKQFFLNLADAMDEALQDYEDRFYVKNSGKLK